MAYWGEAMTYTHAVWNEQDMTGGRAALAKLAPTPAARVAKTVTARESGYLAAVEILYGEGPKARRDTLYSLAMERLVSANPQDDEARLFYALSLLGLGQGVRHVPTYVRAAAIAESVFARNPTHPGAAHYWIHGRDDPDHAAEALPAARALAVIAPDVIHSQHMTSHIFVALGMWDDVVSANANAARTMEGMRHAHGRGPWFCGHINAFLDYGYLEQGRFTEAKRLLAGCREQAAMERPGPSDLDPDNYSFITMWSRYLLDTEQWDGDVALWDIDPGNAAAPRISYWFTRGFAAVRRNDVAAARQALGAFELARGELSKAIPQAGSEPTPDEREFLTRAEVLRLELVGLIAVRAGSSAAGLDTLRRATLTEQRMAYGFGPPFVNQPSHELLGRELLRVGRAPEARRAFDAALTRTPRRTSVLLGLARAAAAVGDSAAATRAYRELATIWHAADTGLPGMAEARRSEGAVR
jgi:tetratricopeptide (TPR) repeat protein